MICTLPINIADFGAVGDGITDDTDAIQKAVNKALCAPTLSIGPQETNGSIFIPPGLYRCTRQIVTNAGMARLSIRGAGPNVSRFLAAKGSGVFSFQFAQQGICQPYGLTIESVGFEADGPNASPLLISYGNPKATSSHFQPSTILRNVTIASGDGGWFANGPIIEAAWNVTMTDCTFSGRATPDNWNALSGNGISMTRMCVNSSFTNVRCNFWASGFDYRNGNTEGLMFANCSFIAVKRGCWVVGAPSEGAGRVSTFTWTGGLIELRVKGTDTGSAAFHLVNVYTALITGVQIITDAITPAHGDSYGLYLDNCRGVVVTACDINAVNCGAYATNGCVAISIHGNTYTNTKLQTYFTSTTTRSRTYGNTCVDQDVLEIDGSFGKNKIGFIN